MKKKTNKKKKYFFIIYKLMPVIVDNKRQTFDFKSNVKKNWGYSNFSYDIYKEIIPTKLPFGIHYDGDKTSTTPDKYPMLKTPGNQIDIGYNQYDLNKMKHRADWELQKKFVQRVNNYNINGRYRIDKQTGVLYFADSKPKYRKEKRSKDERELVSDQEWNKWLSKHRYGTWGGKFGGSRLATGQGARNDDFPKKAQQEIKYDIGENVNKFDYIRGGWGQSGFRRRRFEDSIRKAQKDFNEFDVSEVFYDDQAYDRDYDEVDKSKVKAAHVKTNSGTGEEPENVSEKQQQPGEALENKVSSKVNKKRVRFVKKKLRYN